MNALAMHGADSRYDLPPYWIHETPMALLQQLLAAQKLGDHADFEAMVSIEVYRGNAAEALVDAARGAELIVVGNMAQTSS